MGCIWQDFIAQAAQCPDFRDNIGQLADGIIQLHLTTLAMPFIRKSLDGIGCHERVINERIQVVGMMYVDDLYTRLHIFGLRSGSTPIMVIPVGKLAAAIYFLYRGEQQRKIERQVFAGFESTRTARFHPDQQRSFVAVAFRQFLVRFRKSWYPLRIARG